MNDFRLLFNRSYDVEAKAHGRVNLIGEHTDYNQGFVLPTSIPQSTKVYMARRDDNTVRFFSTNAKKFAFKDSETFVEYEIGKEVYRTRWTDYFQGVTWLLRKRGYELHGFDCLLSSEVPIGSGLSSSAALEISLLKGLNELFNLRIDDLAIARLGQEIENEFVGARVGIMDHMAASLAHSNEALFIDTRDLQFRRIPIPTEKVNLVVINSGIVHSNVHGGYNQRREECELACEILEINSLRELSVHDLDKATHLPERILKRTRHVVTENDRVLAAVNALERHDFVTMGRLFSESHQSMRDDYEISTPEMDILVELAEAESEVYGARLTGAGFGGSIVALVTAGAALKIVEKILPSYKKLTKREATVLVPA